MSHYLDYRQQKHVFSCTIEPGNWFASTFQCYHLANTISCNFYKSEKLRFNGCLSLTASRNKGLNYFPEAHTLDHLSVGFLLKALLMHYGKCFTNSHPSICKTRNYDVVANCFLSDGRWRTTQRPQSSLSSERRPETYYYPLADLSSAGRSQI